MRIPHIALAVLLFAFSGLVLFEARDLDYLTVLGPGPGFFPRWLAGLLAFLAVCLMVGSLRRPDRVVPAGFLPTASNARKLLLILTTLGVATAVLDTAGFALTTFAMNLAILAVLGRIGWLPTLIALAGSFGVYHVFTAWLSVPLPQGWVGW